MIRNIKPKIAVALSGGVDSAVAAKILIDEGYEVIGLFLKFWKYDGLDEGFKKAKSVAEFLDIPFHEIDAREEFKKVVVENFVSEYKNLRTPNPCTLCNPEVKFRLLIDEADKLCCDKIATGHYARIENSEMTNNQDIPRRAQDPFGAITNKYPNSKSQTYCHSGLDSESIKMDPCPPVPLWGRDDNTISSGGYKLKAGSDSFKDQSYMLYRLKQEQLSKVIFPLGELTKNEVREMAKKWGLPVAYESESQEICFLKNTDYREFLRERLGKSYFEPGEIVDSSGNIVGRHEGLVNYTIGQRRGVAQDTRHKIQDTNKMYVIGLDIKKNQLIVGEDKEVYKKEMMVNNLHLVNPFFCHHDHIHQAQGRLRGSEVEDSLNKNLSVKIRSQAQKVNCRIQNSELRIKSGVIKVIFDEPQRAIAPGQSAVYYSGDKVIGGGTIIK